MDQTIKIPNNARDYYYLFVRGLGSTVKWTLQLPEKKALIMTLKTRSASVEKKATRTLKRREYCIVKWTGKLYDGLPVALGGISLAKDGGTWVMRGCR